MSAITKGGGIIKQGRIIIAYSGDMKRRRHTIFWRNKGEKRGEDDWGGGRQFGERITRIRMGGKQ